jgi:thiol-disulfide isomerase/thioredoxin
MRFITVLFGFWLALGFAIADEPRLEKNAGRDDLAKMVGKAPPPLAAKDWLNSAPLKLDELKGKVVVLEFWGTWCTTCLGLIPHHNALAKKYKDQGLVFIGICDAEGSEKMPQIARHYGIEYPIAIDVKNTTADTYKADSTPDFYLIDRRGKLRWADIVTEDVDSAIEQLLAERQE